MDDNWKTIISSQSAELVERKAKLNKKLIGLNFLMRPTYDETLWCDNGAVLASPISFLRCSLASDCSLQNNRNHFLISIRSFFQGCFSLAIIFLKLNFFVSMLFGQSGPDLASHWDEEMASLYSLFHLLCQEFLTVANHPKITLLFSSLTHLGKTTCQNKVTSLVQKLWRFLFFFCNYKIL